MSATATSTESRMPPVFRVNPVAPERDVMDRVVEALTESGIVAYPTDTFYGLGVDPANAAAVDALVRAKGRRSEPLPLIASDMARLEAHIGPLSAVARRLATAFWPGPLTLVVPFGAATLAPGVTAGGQTIAVRVPAHLVARAVAESVGGLVTSTSANRSGEPPASTAQDVVRALADAVTLVLDGGPTAGESASTIVDVTGPHPRLIRPGRVSFDRVLDALHGPTRRE
jgi:L-threonylcarbamoyladenylate synthase